MEGAGSAATPHEGDDRGRELLALVLLEEMARASDGRVGLAVRAWNEPLQDALAAAGDRIPVAERSEEGLVPLRQHLPGLAIGR